MKVVPALWQAICSVSTSSMKQEFDPFVFSMFEKPSQDSPFCLIDNFFISYKGQLSSKLPYDDVINNLQESDYGGIGSIRFKCTYSSINVSIIVFNTGKIKLSGGTPSTIHTNDDMISFIKSLSNSLCVWLPFTEHQQPYICCLNGNMKIPNFSSERLTALTLAAKHTFNRIVEPNLMKRGRRCAYKFYLHANRKFHIAVDYKGHIQVFAAQHYWELQHIVDLFMN